MSRVFLDMCLDTVTEESEHMFKNLKKQPVISRVVLACQIAWMPRGQFEAMIGHLEANAEGSLERVAYFQKVVSLARLCRNCGPFAVLFMQNGALVKNLRNAYGSSIVFWQMNQLGR
jgi:hypothetical protein